METVYQIASRVAIATNPVILGDNDQANPMTYVTFLIMPNHYAWNNSRAASPTHLQNEGVAFTTEKQFQSARHTVRVIDCLNLAVIQTNYNHTTI